MQELSLKLLGRDELYVEFYVDGENFGTQVKNAFGKFGFDSVLPWQGGDYGITDTVLGESARRKGADQAILLHAVVDITRAAGSL